MPCWKSVLIVTYYIPLINKIFKKWVGPRRRVCEAVGKRIAPSIVRHCTVYSRLVPSLYPIKEIDRLQAYHSRDFIGYTVLKIWHHASRLAASSLYQPRSKLNIGKNMAAARPGSGVIHEPRSVRRLSVLGHKLFQNGKSMNNNNALLQQGFV